jgi:PIN domain nuclease of toxin-antitoxin system
VIYILDASAMIAYLRGEPGAETVSANLTDPTNECLVHAVNLCEVYYDFYRANGEEVARAATADLLLAGVQLRDDLSMDFWQAAGALKATLRRISLADCFAITLAQRTTGSVMTSDHHEFDPVASQSLCPILFIR